MSGNFLVTTNWQRVSHDELLSLGCHLHAVKTFGSLDGQNMTKLEQKCDLEAVGRDAQLEYL